VIERPWHKHWPEGVPKTIDYPDIAVHELLRRAAKGHGDRVALSFYGKTITYRDLDGQADRFAAGLRKLGVKPLDRVALVLPNTPHFFVAFFGVLRAGGTVVQTNPLYTPRELEQLWNDAGVETVVALDMFWHNVAKAKPNTRVKRVIVCDAADYLKAPLRQLYPIKRRKDLRKAGHWPLRISDEPWVARFAAILETPPAPGTEPPVMPSSDVAVLQYTGGTTGTPKGAMLTHRNLVANAYQTASWLGTRASGQERFLAAIPLFHVYGLTTVMTVPIVLGAMVILYPNPREIPQILKLISRTKPTLFPGVPTMYIAILRSPHVSKHDLRSIKACVSGAAPLPNEVRHEFERSASGSRSRTRRQGLWTSRTPCASCPGAMSGSLRSAALRS
jgi:long-chain acyl-CoA synthetase